MNTSDRIIFGIAIVFLLVCISFMGAKIDRNADNIKQLTEIAKLSAQVQKSFAAKCCEQTQEE